MSGGTHKAAKGAMSAAKTAKTAGTVGSALASGGTTAGIAAARGLSKTPGGRRALIGIAASPLIAAAVVMWLISGLLGVAGASATTTTEENSLDAAYSIGIGNASLSVYQEAAAASGIPWEILAAIPNVHGSTVEAGSSDTLSDDDLNTARHDDTPVGPFDIDISDLEDQVSWLTPTASGSAAGTVASGHYGYLVQGYPDGKSLEEGLDDLETSADLIASLMSKAMAARHSDLASISLGTDVIYSEGCGATADATAPADPSSAEQPPDTSSDLYDGNGGVCDANAMNPRFDVGDGKESAADQVQNDHMPDDARALKKAYVDVLSHLPIADAGDLAEQTYERAMLWYFGVGQTQCTDSYAAAVGGGDITSAIDGQVMMVTANIRSAVTDFGAVMGKIISARNPDFIALQEQSSRPVSALEAHAPGYTAFKAAEDPAGGGQSLDTAVLWRTSSWTKVAAGRTEIVASDSVYYDKQIVHWHRYATWATLSNATGGTISIVSVHHMTNPWRIGPDMPARQRTYGAAMDTLTGLLGQLGASGPVLVGGDFNAQIANHSPNSPWAKMKGAGYNSVWDNFNHGAAAIDYLFYPASPAITPLGAGTLGNQGTGLGYGMDHPAAWAKYRLDSSPTGTGTGATGGAGSGGTAPISLTPPPTGGSGAPTLSGAPDIPGLNAEQVANAQTILAADNAIAGGEPGALVGIITAYTESGLRTDPGSMGGSYGLFQQTPSAGWGTLAQVQDPQYASTAFYRHLGRVSGWQNMQPWTAAQAVQRSGAGDPTSTYYLSHHLTWGLGGNYKQNLAEAQSIVNALYGGSVDTTLSTTGCDGDSLLAGSTDLGVTGHGEFTANSSVVGHYTGAQLTQRAHRYADAVSGWLDTGVGRVTYSTTEDYEEGRCQHFVANLSGYPVSAAPGAGTALDKWGEYLMEGRGHLATSADGMSPPIGAELYYRTSNPAGHVVIYLGNNTVISTDMGAGGQYQPGHIGIVPESAVASWGPYLGWAPPIF